LRQPVWLLPTCRCGFGLLPIPAVYPHHPQLYHQLALPTPVAAAAADVASCLKLLLHWQLLPLV
jgi:hypothetical protein